MVHGLVHQCQGNCRYKLSPADKGDYLVMKTRVCISFINKQCKMDSKLCPLYIHFKAECLKEYTRQMHDVLCQASPFSETTFGRDTLARLPEEVKVFL